MNIVQSKRLLKMIAGFATFVILILLYLYSLQPQGQQKLSENQMLSQEIQSLISIHSSKDRLSIVNFWAHWCRPCLEELPDLVKIVDSYRDKGLEVLMVNMDKDNQERENSYKVREKYKDRFTFKYFTESELKKIKNELDILALPTSLIVSQGKVLATVTGTLKNQEQKVEEILKDFFRKRGEK